MVRVIGGKRYNTETAKCIADDRYWDGRNYERNFRNTFLYRTEKGSYFTTTITAWQGECNSLRPLSQKGAVEMWEELEEHNVAFEEAFPDVEVKDA